MKRKGLVIIMFLFVAISLASAQNSDRQKNDSVAAVQSLPELLVLAPNIERMDNYMMIRPDAVQRKHASNAFELLQNCQLPGVEVNMNSGRIEAMGANATLYINGNECDIRELTALRPKDIEKIEYHDIPKGKYSKDRVAFNFVVKQYKYGGYTLAKAQQTVGYNHGIYDLASAINAGKESFVLYTGAEYTNVNNEKSTYNELFKFDTPIFRSRQTATSSRKRNQYAMLRYQHRGMKNYLVSKLSLLNNRTPHSANSGTSTEETEKPASSVSSSLYSKAIMPKFDLTGEYAISNNQKLNYGLHFAYEHNVLGRKYEENSYSTFLKEKENAFRCQASCIYNVNTAKGTLTGEVYHYQNIWNSWYLGDNAFSQKLRKAETLTFITYNRAIGKKTYLYTRLGADWQRYTLDGKEIMNHINPRLNLRLQQQVNKGSLLFSLNYVNSTYGTNVINNAIVDIDKYVSTCGNSKLNNSHDIVSYVYFMKQYGKTVLSSVSQYNYCHNYVTADNYIRDNRLVQSYKNDDDTHLLSQILGLSFRVSSSFAISGDMRYAFYRLNANDKSLDDFTANINMSYYIGGFAIKPYISIAQKTLDFSSGMTSELPTSYGMRLSYSHHNLYVSANIASPFGTRKYRQDIDTSAYSMATLMTSDTYGKYVELAVQYSLDYGKRTNKIDNDINKTSNSSLLPLDIFGNYGKKE